MIHKTALSLLFLISIFYSCDDNPDQAPPNILFIALDDLRPELNCFGAGHIVSPNIDQVAEEGIIFRQAYCQVPVCGASRASLLTGIRPNMFRFIDVYPTLCDLAGINIPDHVQGESLVKYYNNPNHKGKPFVYSRFIKGESVKNQEFRYTEWQDSSQSRYAEMLYNHRTDPDENYNISGNNENADIINALREANLKNRIQSGNAV